MRATPSRLAASLTPVAWRSTSVEAPATGAAVARPRAVARMRRERRIACGFRRRGRRGLEAGSLPGIGTRAGEDVTRLRDACYRRPVATAEADLLGFLRPHLRGRVRLFPTESPPAGALQL